MQRVGSTPWRQGTAGWLREQSPQRARPTNVRLLNRSAPINAQHKTKEKPARSSTHRARSATDSRASRCGRPSRTRRRWLDRHQLHVGVAYDLRPSVVHAAARSFGDPRSYALAPPGSFTGAVPGWQLLDGARSPQIPCAGHRSRCPPGASAISPGMCVDLDYPHFRFFHQFVGQGSGRRRDPASRSSTRSLPGPEWTEVKQFDGKQGSPAGAGSWRISPRRRPQAGLRRQRAGRALRRAAVHRAQDRLRRRVARRRRLDRPARSP